MKQYILDTSVVIQEIITDAQTANVHAMFEQAAQTDIFLVPEFCILECTNVLWKQVRFQTLPQEQALILVQDLLALPLMQHPTSALLPDALNIGLKHSLAVYDSLYIAMAKKLDIPFITVDVKQETAAKAEGVTLKTITDFIPNT